MLEVSKVSYWYSRCSPPAVHELDLLIPAGQCTAIVGASGAGKSTILRLLCGLAQLDSHRAGESGERIQGSIKFDGHELERPDRRFGYVPQNTASGLMPGYSARDNIHLAVGSGGISDSEAELAEKLLIRTGIRDVAHLPVVRLSGGQRQRVAICRALISNPSVLFMDEPFASLDPGLRPRMDQLLVTLRSEAEAPAVVIVTHDIGSATALADVVLGVALVNGLPKYHSWSAGAGRIAKQAVEEWVVGSSQKGGARATI